MYCVARALATFPSLIQVVQPRILRINLHRNRPEGPIHNSQEVQKNREWKFFALTLRMQQVHLHIKNSVTNSKKRHPVSTARIRWLIKCIKK
jgi:hypothetical protein